MPLKVKFYSWFQKIFFLKSIYKFNLTVRWERTHNIPPAQGGKAMSKQIKGTSFASKKKNMPLEVALLCIFPILCRKMILCFHSVPSCVSTEPKMKWASLNRLNSWPQVSLSFSLQTIRFYHQPYPDFHPLLKCAFLPCTAHASLPDHNLLPERDLTSNTVLYQYIHTRCLSQPRFNLFFSRLRCSPRNCILRCYRITLCVSLIEFVSGSLMPRSQ